MERSNGFKKHFRIEPTQWGGLDVRAGQGMPRGFSNLVGKDVIHKVVLKGNLSSAKVLVGPEMWARLGKGEHSRREAAESR